MEEEDELDKLLNSYEHQAQSDLVAVQAAVTKKPNHVANSMIARREEGLSTPLAPETKGYQLLAKMGYKPGQALGKSQPGRVIPLDLNLKTGRSGLGVDEEKKRRKEAVILEQKERAAKRSRGEQELQETYVALVTTDYAARQAEKHLLEAQKVCENLDRKAGLQESERWLPQQADATAEEGEEEPPIGWQALPVRDKLQDVMGYLRSTYSYCIFCGCQYSNEQDLLQNCPGLLDSDH
eukprot:jgi/Botrbrau1/17547/Bobra.0766s0003.1